MGFLKYLLYRIGSKIFWLGLVVVMVFIIVDQTAFYMTAIDVDATVERVETNCTLSWKELGHRAHRDMECAKARAIKASDPSTAYRISENTRTELAYTAPDGTSMTQWTHIAEVEGHTLVRGDRLTAAVADDDYSDVRRAFDPGDFMLMFAILLGSIVVVIVGWAFKGTASGSLSARASSLLPN